MDLATESPVSISKSSSVHEDDETDVAPSVANIDDIYNVDVASTTSNCGVIEEVGNSDSLSQSGMNNVVPDTGFDQPMNSPPNNGKAKGHGLKKWKRIKRNIGNINSRASVDEVPSNAPDEYSRPVKRGLSNAANLVKPSHHFSVDDREKSEASVGSVNIGSKIMENGEYVHQGSSSDSRLAVGGAIFAAGNDSENSEDRSSRSSTAASVPKARHQKVVEKNNVSGKGLGSSLSQRSSLKGKSWVETCKKAKGERVKAEKENSHSSLESDSRSSNFVFMQDGFSASSNGNGTKSGNVTNYDDGEYSGEAEAGERLFNEDLQADYNIENVDNDLSEDDIGTGSSSWKAKQESSGNHLPSTHSDLLVKSVFTLRSVQEALEKELQKFAEIGKENDFTSAKEEVDQTQFENIEQSGSTSPLESELITLTVKANTLEERLGEAITMLKAKELRLLELEATAHLAKSENGEPSSNDPKIAEIETEADSIFMKKIEAEVEFMAISSKIKNFKNIGTDQIALVEEQKHLVYDQKHLVDEQKQMLNKLEVAESKAKTLEKHAEEALTIKNRVFKVTGCFSLQLLLLVLFFWLFVPQLSPQPEVVVVPT